MSEQETPKVYSRKPKSVKIPMEADDGSGKVEYFTMRELIGGERNRYLGSQNGKTKMKNGVEVRDFTGACADLLSICLSDPEGKPVPFEEIDSWPSEMQMDLYLKAVKLSGLDKKSAEDEAKN